MRASLLYLSLLLCTIPAAALVIDEAEMLSAELEEEIAAFNEKSAIPLSVITTTQSYNVQEQAAENFQAYALKLLLFYSKAEDAAVVVQPVDAGIPEASVVQLLKRYRGAYGENLPALITELMARVGEWQSMRKGQRAVCALLRDGKCEQDCQGTDLDCQCGDSICQAFESPEICAVDCRAQPTLWCAFQRDGKCGACAIRDIDCPVELGVVAARQRPAFIIGVTLACIMLLMIAILRLWRRR